MPRQTCRIKSHCRSLAKIYKKKRKIRLCIIREISFKPGSRATGWLPELGLTRDNRIPGWPAVRLTDHRGVISPGPGEFSLVSGTWFSEGYRISEVKFR
jgi:hypothetical protein